MFEDSLIVPIVN